MREVAQQLKKKSCNNSNRMDVRALLRCRIINTVAGNTMPSLKNLKKPVEQNLVSESNYQPINPLLSRAAKA
jgi:hypothetical protein